MLNDDLKASLLALLRDDPDVRAAVREAVTGVAGQLIDVRTFGHPDAPPRLVTAIEVPAETSPATVKAAVASAVTRSSTPEDRRPGWLRK